MIPHDAPPFSLSRLILTCISTRITAPEVDDLERAAARLLGVAEAVILPSVRTGILLLLDHFTATPARPLVVGPAYTCMVVHEAMILSGARTRYLEPSATGFHIPVDAVLGAVEPGCCLVLSEMYGQAYSQEFLGAIEVLDFRVRIFDGAMGIPDPALVAALGPRDVALYSFGIGKALCAGGGAVACLNDASLARALRSHRDTITDHSRAAWRSDPRACASMAIRTRWLCALAVAVQDREERLHHEHTRRRSTVETTAPQPSSVQTAAPAPEREYPGLEWTHRMTALERALALRNLKDMNESAKRRREQAAEYLRILGSTSVCQEVSFERLPTSHFPIRVAAGSRDDLRSHLRRCGIDSGREFPFSGVLPRAEFPGTLKASLEIVTLPLGEQVSLRNVTHIAELVHRYLTSGSAA